MNAIKKRSNTTISIHVLKIKEKGKEKKHFFLKLTTLQIFSVKDQHCASNLHLNIKKDDSEKCIPNNAFKW